VVMFWVVILAVSILLYVLLDGFDLGIGILFGLTGNEERRRAMLSAVAPIWDGNETWLVVAGVVLWGHFVARISSWAKSALRIDIYLRRTYSGRPSFSIRLSDATPMATSVVCRPSVRERSASPITRL
jgi:hypothetical protein